MNILETEILSKHTNPSIKSKSLECVKNLTVWLNFLRKNEKQHPKFISAIKRLNRRSAEKEYMMHDDGGYADYIYDTMRDDMATDDYNGSIK